MRYQSRRPLAELVDDLRQVAMGLTMLRLPEAARHAQAQGLEGEPEAGAAARPGKWLALAVPTAQAQLFVTTLAAAVARRRPQILSNAVDPGWVPTKMGGLNAPDDLRLGHRTQEWLATSDDRDACTSSGYWHHQRRVEPHPSVNDVEFQDRLLDELARATDTRWREEQESTSHTRGER